MTIFLIVLAVLLLIGVALHVDLRRTEAREADARAARFIRQLVMTDLVARGHDLNELEKLS